MLKRPTAAARKATVSNGRRAALPAYHHGDLRNALIVEGRRLLEDVGPKELSLRQLARSVGVSIAAPSHHFGDKAGLLAAIAADGFRELAALRRSVAAATQDPLQRVYGTMECYVRFAERERGLFYLMVGPRILERENFKELLSTASDSFRLFASAVCDYARTQGWAEKDLNPLVHAAWSVEHGLAMLLLARRVPAWGYKMELQQVMPFSLSLLLSGIAAGPDNYTRIAADIGGTGSAAAPARKRSAPR